MRALDTKVLRDLVHMKGQVIAVEQGFETRNSLAYQAGLFLPVRFKKLFRA